MNDAQKEYIAAGIHCAICGKVMPTHQLRKGFTSEDGDPSLIWKCPLCIDWLMRLANPEEHGKLGINQQGDQV